MTVSSPAAAPYAATDAAMFPVETVPTRVKPRARACAIQAAVPRSLNDQVGFALSFLTTSDESPSSPARRDRGTSGVFPSPSDSHSPGSNGKNAP